MKNIVATLGLLAISFAANAQIQSTQPIDELNISSITITSKKPIVVKFREISVDTMGSIPDRVTCTFGLENSIVENATGAFVLNPRTLTVATNEGRLEFSYGKGGRSDANLGHTYTYIKYYLFKARLTDDGNVVKNLTCFSTPTKSTNFALEPEKLTPALIQSALGNDFEIHFEQKPLPAY